MSSFLQCFNKQEYHIVEEVGNLTSLNTSLFDDTSITFTQDVKDFWQLFKNGTQTVDGITVIAASPTGTWVRLNQPHPDWRNITEWYIDNQHGNDTNSGTEEIKPIKTWAELRRRVRGNEKPLPYLITINILSDYTNDPYNDFISLDFSFGPATEVIIKGKNTQTLNTGTVSSFVEEDTGLMLNLNYNTNSDIAGCKQMSFTYSSNTEVDLATTLAPGATGVVLSSFMSDDPPQQAGKKYPSARTTLVPGTWDIRQWLNVNEGTGVDVYANIYIYDVELSTYTLLTTTNSISTGGGTNRYQLKATTPLTTIKATDRIKIDICANNVSGNSRTIHLFYNGSQYRSSVVTPSSPCLMYVDGFDWTSYVGSTSRIKLPNSQNGYAYVLSTPAPGWVELSFPYYHDVPTFSYSRVNNLPTNGDPFIIEKITAIAGLVVDQGVGTTYYIFEDILLDFAGFFNSYDGSYGVGYFGCIFDIPSYGYVYSGLFAGCFFFSAGGQNQYGPDAGFYPAGSMYIDGGAFFNLKLEIYPGITSVQGPTYLRNIIFFECGVSAHADLVTVGVGFIRRGTINYSMAAILAQADSLCTFQTGSSLWGGGFGSYVVVIYKQGVLTCYSWDTYTNFNITSGGDDMRFQSVLINKQFYQLPFWNTDAATGALVGQ